MKPARKRVQAMAQGRGRGERVVIPLAFGVAARIAARPLAQFLTDPTQLANGLGELQQAIDADGSVCALAGGMELASAAGAGLDSACIAAQGPVAASLEACRRLRQSHGDELALLAGLTGPATLARQFDADRAAAAEVFAALVKAFCSAGADVILLIEEAAVPDDEIYADGLRTAANIARFHQALLLGQSPGLLPQPHALELAAPSSGGSGLITTTREVPADADIAALAQWVRLTRA